jgi:hypothetical protein
MSNAAPVPPASTAAGDTGAVLRTLSPALRGLERGLRNWLDSPHRHPLSTINRAALEGLALDLRRQADALDVDRPLLVVMLLGGTGVGKSTLLNALAGGTIAQASFTRPTTRDPVVYYHESIRPDRLDPALRHCRLIMHDRPALAQKVIVDTPDVDSTDLSNRDKLIRLMPVADVVLYIGSQEKYHDQLVWEQFLLQRRRRAFAFVLNKWDRCVHTPGGVRPDEDLLRDLEAEGFQSPLLFRTTAQVWLDRALRSAPPSPVPVAGPVAVPAAGIPVAVAFHPATGPSPGSDGAASPDNRDIPEVPEGDQFLDLVEWLEKGLSRLEIEAIKARGVSQMLESVQHALAESAPPDLTEVAARTRSAWSRPLQEEASASAEVLLNTLEPYQREIEHHFALEGQRRFHGLMAGYLHLVTKAMYVGSNLREHLPSVLPRSGSSKSRESSWDLALFTRACSEVAANRQLDARSKALANRLLVEADEQGFPLTVLNEPVEALSHIDWRQRYAQILSEILSVIERTWTQPRGMRSLIQTVVVFLANWLPPLALLATLIRLLALVFNLWGDRSQPVQWLDALLPLIVLLVVLVIMHLLIVLLLPLRWSAIRAEFHARLQDRLQAELEHVYLAAPEEVAGQLREERKKVEKLINETREVATWLERQEQSASIAGLYGN